MAKTRSPNYPVIGLPDALKRARQVWDKEHHGKMSQEVAVKHMGYNTLNGASMGVVSALRKYGLLEGDGNALKLTQTALSLLHDPVGSPQRQAALRQAALAPSLFQEFYAEFGEHMPSEENLRSYLLKNGFTPSAASSANRAYRETIALVGEDKGGYNAGESTEESLPKETGGLQLLEPSLASSTISSSRQQVAAVMPAQSGYKQDVFSLLEGEAVLRWPESLSKESYEDFKAWLELELRKVARSVRPE